MKIDIYSPTIRRREMSAVLTAMVENRIGPGEQAKTLIQAAREKGKFDYCLALRSPVIALSLALKSLGLKRGQGVLISALSPVYYARVIEDLGLVAIYCDVTSSLPSMSLETVKKALTSVPGELEPRCIVLHHTLGFIPDGADFAELGLPVIEDCSQSYGTLAGEDSASDGEGSNVHLQHISAGNSFSILGLEERDIFTSGGGALLFSMNRRDSTALRNLGDLPLEYGLPDMNAALAVVQFREAEKNFLKRREIARLYTQSALKTRHKMFVQQSAEYNNYAFPLVLESGMNEVKAYARRKDITIESAFENSLIGSSVVSQENCPEAYSLFLRTVLFPLYPRLGMTNAGKVAKLILTLP